MRTLLIDLYDVIATPVIGDSVTLEAPDVRPADDGGVIRPYHRLVELEAGRATVEVYPGPLTVKIHNTYGQQIVLEVVVPEGEEPITLRQLVLLETGDLDDVPGIREALDGKADVEHQHVTEDVDGLREALAGKASSNHGHTLDDVVNLVATLTGIATNIDALNFILENLGIEDIGELQAILDGKAAALHTHTVADVPGLQAALDAKAPSEHTHQLSDIAELANILASKATTGALADGLAGKADKGHVHALDDVTSLRTILDGKVDATVWEQATKEFADERIEQLIDGAPENLDTLSEIADKLNADDDVTAGIINTLSGKAEKSHAHTVAQVNGLQAELNAKVNAADTGVVCVQAHTSGSTNKPITANSKPWAAVGNSTVTVDPGRYMLVGYGITSAPIYDRETDVHIETIALPAIINYDVTAQIYFRESGIETIIKV